MTNRDFFRLMIKLFGVYQFCIIVFTVLPSNFSLIFSDLFSRWTSIATFLLMFLVTAGIFYFMIKFPHKIIDFFKLDKGFDNDRITINNFNSISILQAGLIFIAGFLVVENFAAFFTNLIYYFKMSNLPEDLQKLQTSQDLIVTGINLIIGFSLIIFRKQISEKLT